jgi:hypothetical protein
MAHDHVAVQKRQAIAYWRLNHLNRPVKVTSVSRPPMFWGEGFVTCYKFVGGRTLDEAERILGLRVGELGAGAYFHEFLALPNEDQFELKGYSQCPDGQNWTPASDYPAGLGAPQWRILPNTFVQSRVAAVVEPGGRFP